jgi:cholinesterase
MSFWLLLEAFAPQTHIYRTDPYDWLQAVLADSFHFGFTDVTDPCLVTTPTVSLCSNPYVNLFWDVYHPTTFGHSMFATFSVQAINQQ